MPASLLLATFALLLLPRMIRPARADASEFRGVVGLLWWINAFYSAAWHRLDTGRAPLPARGPAILVSNHTCGIDHTLLQAGCDRLLGFMIAREYYEPRLFRPFCDLAGCIPVDRNGRDLAATRAALRALEEGRVVPVFPEGKITPEQGRVIGPCKSGAAYLALRSGAPVVPAFIYGTPRTNEILPSMIRPSQARVRYGPPIDLDDLRAAGSGRDQVEEAAGRIEAALRALQAEARAADPTWWSSPAPEPWPSTDGTRSEPDPRPVPGLGPAGVGVS